MKAAALLLALLLTGTAQAAEDNHARTGDVFDRGLTQADFPRTRELAPGIYTYEDLRASEPKRFKTTVNLIVVTNDGVLLADAQGNRDATQRLVDHIKKLTPQPVKYVVVASEHGDHTAGNEALTAAWPNVVFIATPVSAKAMAKTPVQETVADKRTITLGGKRIDVLNLGRAHTGGDLAVYVPDQKVLFLSEIFTQRLFPSMRTAYPTEWLETIRKAQALNATWNIGGHGFVDDAPVMKAELEEYRKAIATVVAESKRLHDAGIACAAPEQDGARVDPAACPAAEKANWGPYATWTEHALQAPTSIARVYMELDGKLK